MRRIMSILMVVALLMGVSVIVPKAADVNGFSDSFETFEGGIPAGWRISEGSAENVSQTDSGALQLIGNAETDVIKLQKEITYVGWQSYEASAWYKLCSYESGNGFRMYFKDISAEEMGASNYTTAVTEEYKSLAFEVHYDYDVERTGNLIIELSGKGTVLVGEVGLRLCINGLIPNGDFEADTYSTRTKMASGVSAGITREENGNGVAYIEGKTWSEGLTFKVGEKVVPGKTYIISFRYKNAAGAQPCLYLYFGTEKTPKSTYDEMSRTEYHPNFAEDSDGKVKVTPTNDWKTFYASFTVPADGTITDKNYRKLNYIGIRGSNSETRSYFDDIRFMEAASEMEYTNTGDSSVGAVPTAGETLRTRCFYVKETANVSETATLVQAFFTEDTNGVRQLLSVNLNSQLVTAKNQYITVENQVPEADGKTVVAESYLLRGAGSLSPIINKAILH
ncbi:MAG: hypothetical protein E7390_01460 [Ruminococcaceae bacterium]|nr:hypothetical protein [Oscillospiraceae bacterium]